MTEHAVYNTDKSTPVPAVLHPKSLRQSRASTPIPSRMSRGGNWPTYSVRWEAEPQDFTFTSARTLHDDAATEVPQDGVFVHRIHLQDDRRLHLQKGSPHPTVTQALLTPSRESVFTCDVTVGGQIDSMAALDRYNSHFGLASRPFSLLPDPDFLFWSETHRRTYAMLEYGILSHAPITLITGEIGAGKTTLVRELMNSLGDDVRIGLMSNTQAAPDEMLQWVLMSLGQATDAAATYVDLVETFRAYLFAEQSAGNRVFLIFDEAQNLSLSALEELRMLTNINAGKDAVLQILLVGQPELQQTMRRAETRWFAQRISACWHLSALDASNVQDYIAHRLSVAGATHKIFSDAAITLIHAATSGIARRVNHLCELALVSAFARGVTTVDADCVQAVIDDGNFFAAPLETPLMIAAE